MILGFTAESKTATGVQWN